MRRASRRPASECNPRSSVTPVRAPGWPAEKVRRNRWRAPAVRARNPSSHLSLALDPRDDLGTRLALIASEFANHFPGGIEEHDGWETFFIDAILLAQPFILLLQFGRLLFPLRKIDFHQNQIFRGVGGEFLAGSHRLPRAEERPAQTGAVKIKNNFLVL